jgi:hypothetical protein
MPVKAQFNGTISSAVYVPGGKLFTTICPPSDIIPDASPINSKPSGAPSGSVCFSTIIEPYCLFVNIAFTVSPGSSSKYAVSPIS